MDFDAVLEATPPRLTGPEVLAIAAATFGVEPAGARDLGSERDQTFLLHDPGGSPLAVMKVSNAAEDPGTLDMEALAVLHAGRVDPTLPLAIPWPVPGLTAADDAPERRRASIARDDGIHHVRMYEVLPGRQRIEARSLPDRAVGDWGVTTARLGLALRGFVHPRAQRTMLWDVQHAARTRALVASIRDARQRELVERTLDRFESVVLPAWPSLRAQVVHSDLTVDNALTDEAGRITGIVDFGDMSHSALITDLASVLDSLVVGRGEEELFRLGRLVLDGYQRHVPLEPLELRLMGELFAARAAVTIAISSWRSDLGLEDRAFAERYNEGAAATLEILLGVGWDEVARRFGAEPVATRSTVLVARRDAVLGSAIEPLTYERPVHVAHAAGTWITDVDGRTYLDAYNNVPCVGHAHPRVSEAIARQSRVLNTNLRYLHGSAIDLAERLVATCPPGLDTVLFVNSGSEANDLAWRLAAAFTGGTGGLCTGYAYHGVTEATAALSPESWRAGRRPDHIETWPAPDPYRAVALDAAPFAAALDRLAARDVKPAAVILDGVLTSDGYPEPAPSLVADWLARTHDAGALWIADEVQGGHGRTGTGLWSFERSGIVPDLVTLGKPMGNGHPIGAVITRREIVERFADETVFFSTFGGNQVSVAAAHAVLDVIADERILARVVEAGAALRAALDGVADRYPDRIGEVRGPGLAIGVEIVRDVQARTPDGTLAGVIKEGLRDRGVLVGTTGREGNVLKVRPPLAFTAADVPVIADAIEATLASLPARR